MGSNLGPGCRSALCVSFISLMVNQPLFLAGTLVESSGIH